MCDVSALGVEAARVSVLGRGSNRGFGLDGINVCRGIGGKQDCGNRFGR